MTENKSKLPAPGAQIPSPGEVNKASCKLLLSKCCSQYPFSARFGGRPLRDLGSMTGRRFAPLDARAARRPECQLSEFAGARQDRVWHIRPNHALQ